MKSACGVGRVIPLNSSPHTKHYWRILHDAIESAKPIFPAYFLSFVIRSLATPDSLTSKKLHVPLVNSVHDYPPR
jgi:hypothetical protein